MLAKLKYWGHKLSALRYVCITGLLTCVIAFVWLLFQSDHELDKWLLPCATAFGWFACLYALLNFALLLPEQNQANRSYWQRLKYKVKTFFAWLLLIVFGLLSLNLLFISFRAIRLFYG